MQPHWRNRWSIGIYGGPDPLRLAPPPDLAQPVLGPDDVTDVEAQSVADPFLLRRQDGWHLFFELLDGATGRGAIGWADSDDGLRWRYRQVVLREPFHLSYPHVFEWDGEVFMTPETRQAASVRLYRADPFPHRWSFVSELLSGPYADPTPVRHGGRWWLFAQRGLDELCLATSDRLESGWSPHPQSPVVAGNRRRTRPGGRMIRHGGRWLRFAQDGLPWYGFRLRAFEVLELDPERYAEREVATSPPLRATGEGWNALGMHHLDALPTAEGRWLAAVDAATLGHS